ncbi:MAG: ZIP family metal transporter [Candidatus Pacearchaeota archaeon]|nr:MAG: ZIP family metal transporter [Candidatus Pacearchaeota archaeon]
MLLWILISVIIVSLIAFVGIFFLAFKEKFLKKILILFIALASGALLGGAFFHLIPESLELGIGKVSLYIIGGILIFFVLEKFLYWRHCHKGKCPVHTFRYTILIGDALHNFIDGLIIAAAYLINIGLGITTTIAIILHEIPQEIGDFGVLVYGGFKKGRAMLYNFFSALTAILGALVGYFLSASIDTTFLLPFAAGGFIYIAATDLIPELHKRIKISESLLQLIFILVGLALMWLLKCGCF